MNWIRPRGNLLMVLAATILPALAAPFFWPLLLTPLLVLLIPALACWLERRVGMLAALGMLAGLGFGLTATVGPLGPLFILILIAPALLIQIWAFRQNQPFWPSVGYTALALTASGLAILGLLWQILGQSPIEYAIQIFEQFVETNPLREQLLILFYQAGFARISAELPQTTEALTALLLLPETQKELFQTLMVTMDTSLRNSVPIQLIMGSMLGGLFAVAWPRWDARKDMDCPSPPPVPAFATWRMSSSVSWPAILSLLILFLFSSANVGAFAMATVILYAGLQFAFSIQGLAVIDHFLRKRNTRRGLRKLAILLAYGFFSDLCTLLGILDALLNLRKLQTPGQKPFPPWLNPDDDNKEE